MVLTDALSARPLAPQVGYASKSSAVLTSRHAIMVLNPLGYFSSEVCSRQRAKVKNNAA